MTKDKKRGLIYLKKIIYNIFETLGKKTPSDKEDTMKNKIFKICVILVMIATMTMTNFIFVGNSLISYALDSNNNTNNNNIEFNVYFKNEQGEKVSNLDMIANHPENTLYVYLNVKQEGYFNGTIHLEEGANFQLVGADNQYVESVENNTIKLYNVTAGTSIEIPVKIKPIKEETYSIGLLDVESKMTIEGIYKDSSEKDKKIKASKTVTLKFVDELTQEDIVNEMAIITNKVSNIGGEEKRIVQLSWNIGTKSNSYPIKEIIAKIKNPIETATDPQIETQVALNTMTSYDSKYEKGVSEFTLKNEKTEEETIAWKAEGIENIILTYIYDKDVVVNEANIQPEVKITLYNQKEINSTSQTDFKQEEKDAVIEIAATNQENEIYKGKLVAGIDRQYTTKTAVKVNLAQMVNEITVQEEPSTYTVNETENIANIFYVQTAVSKEQFDRILGENGVITITNQTNQVIGTIDAKTQADENGNIVIHYGDSQTQAIKIQTTAPIAEGVLEFNHVKNSKETQRQIVKEASRIHHVISYQYNQGLVNQIENNIALQNTVTESKIAVDTEQLSTVIGNHIKMKITLLSNEEKYDLFENPRFTIALPQQVENIQITNISKLYDDNNEFGDSVKYAINGNNIHLVLDGRQTNYTTTVEGITLVIDAQVQVSKTAATNEEQIVMTYQNNNAVSYANNATASTPIKITAPKEITAVNSIQELSVETIGEEEKTEIMMPKGVQAKQVQAQMEIINSNVADISNVKILGDFPTDDSQNNMGIAITRGVQVTGVENAKVYYSANENATDDLTEAQNGWTEELNGVEAKNYLILLDNVAAQSSVQANYQMAIPENLEYNEMATEGYSVNATNSQTGTEMNVSATRIAMQTGVGPKVESQIYAMVGADTLKENDVVKNGEVIKYQVKVSNTGTEDATNIKVIGKVPEGTTLVEPMKHYEYTGAAYYKENTEVKSHTTTIEGLKVGESKIVEYEVRVNANVAAGTNITNETEVQYGEAKTKSTISNKVEASNVRASVKQVTEYPEGIYVGDYLKYFVILENMSNAEQKDVVVQTNLSENAEVQSLELITGMEVEDITDDDLVEIDELEDMNKEIANKEDNEEEHEQKVISEEEDEDDNEIVDNNRLELTYQKELNIGNVSSGETKVLVYTVKTKTVGNLDMSVSVKANNQITRSNVWKCTLQNYDLKANMTTSTESQFVDIGDEIDYNITLENIGTGDASAIKITDEIPIDLTIESITIDGEEKDILDNSNKINIYTDVKANTISNITIKTKVDYHEKAEPTTITNSATVEANESVIATTQEITHIIKAFEEDKKSGDSSSNGGSANNTQNTKQKNYMIAGVAWLDSNINGVKDEGESVLADIKVKLLNVDTNEIVKDANGTEIATATNSTGMYILQNVPNGKYIVIFEYDTTKYGLTTYQVSGAPDGKNSKAVMNELNVNGVTTKVASSDIITIGDTDISNINIGLFKLENFDLKLEKYISQILIQNASGSTVKKYNNTDMAKVELDAKKIKGSTVLIEYNIIVSNVGEVDGYVKKVVDYMPSDLKFSSELNKDWYQTNGMLYNASLANEKIAAGEAKTITLILTKSMTENNTGLTTNAAEIAEDYNALGIKDSNSTPGNKAEGENDMSRAEVIISIRTGGMVYISIIIITIIIGIVVTFVMIKRKKQNGKDII